MSPTARDDPGESHVRRGAPRDIIDVEWWSSEGAVGGLIRADIRADRARTAFLAAVVGPDRDPIVVIDHELPMPEAAVELRASGIWTALICEEPLDHWTVGLEAFGLVVDPDGPVDPDTFGHRVPVGLDLDLDTIGDVGGAPGELEAGLRVHGEVLLADEVIELDGLGLRRRRWDGDEPALTPLGDARPLASLAIGWPAPTPTIRRYLTSRDGDVGWAAAQ